MFRQHEHLQVGREPFLGDDAYRLIVADRSGRNGRGRARAANVDPSDYPFAEVQTRDELVCH